jgi:hypothetical protein
LSQECDESFYRAGITYLAQRPGGNCTQAMDSEGMDKRLASRFAI